MINTADDTRKLVERAVLIGIRPHDQDPAVAAEHLAELKELVANLNIPVVGEVVVSLRNPQPEYFTGTGKRSPPSVRNGKPIVSFLTIRSPPPNSGTGKNW